MRLTVAHVLRVLLEAMPPAGSALAQRDCSRLVEFATDTLRFLNANPQGWLAALQSAGHMPTCLLAGCILPRFAVPPLCLLSACSPCTCSRMMARLFIVSCMAGL